MLTININGFLTDFTGGRNEVSINTSPKTVGEALSELWKIHPGLRDRVLTEQGVVRMHVNVFLDDENIRRKELLDTSLPENCDITILPSVSGGVASPIDDRFTNDRLGPNIASMKATWNGAVLAESDKTVIVEGNHYFPSDSIKKEYFHESGTHTSCPWKGEASYYNVVVEGQVNKDAAWYYAEPKPAADEIRNRVAFWRGVKVEE